MQFAEDSPSTFSIQSCDADGIVIDERRISRSVVVSPDNVQEWSPRDVAELTHAHVEQLAALDAEIVIIGSGRAQRFPPARVLVELQNRGIGVEVMANDAACRTFNVLLSEDRQVVLALIQHP